MKRLFMRIAQAFQRFFTKGDFREGLIVAATLIVVSTLFGLILRG